MARYTVTGFDCAADGMERLRMKSESILLACPSGDSSPADIAEQWESDIDSCDRGDGFDYDAAAEAVRAWAADNGDAIARELSDVRAMVDRGDLNWNDESADEFDSVTFRLYLHDAWHGEPSPYRHGRLVALKSGAVALVLLDSPHSAWADAEAERLALEAAPGDEFWTCAAYPVGDREREAKPGLVWLQAGEKAGPIAPPSYCQLVANTTRAAYWFQPGVGYTARHADESAPLWIPSGYTRLDSLMRLKGEQESTIARTCQPDGSHKPESWNYGPPDQFDSVVRELLAIDASRQDSGREPRTRLERLASDAIAALCAFSRESGHA